MKKDKNQMIWKSKLLITFLDRRKSASYFVCIF
jgi:hypothetical protein